MSMGGELCYGWNEADSKWLEGIKLEGAQTLRTELHTMNLCLQNSFGESQYLLSRKTLQKLNKLQALPFPPFLRTESQRG